MAGRHHHFDAEREYAKLELVDCFSRIDHRNPAHCGKPIAVWREELGGHLVGRPHRRAPVVDVGMLEVAESATRIHNREVDAELVETFMKEFGQQRGRPIERVRRLHPPRASPHPLGRALGRSQAIPEVGLFLVPSIGFERVRATLVA
jgi:hypothetical protein